MELESQRENFRRRGLGLAALSYDSVEILADFAARRRIGYPLLSDPQSKVIRAFGILNDVDYPPGHRAPGDAYSAHGVPYPGTFVLDREGRVIAKHFEDRYAERRTGASLLALEGASPGALEGAVQTDHFTLRLSVSNPTAAPGQRVTLLLDFELAEKRHAYAPGVVGYRPLGVRLEPSPLFTARQPVFPASRPYRFEPLDETVPVFEGRFRVTQDITLGDGRALAQPLKDRDPRIEVVGSLDYQVCSDTVCFPPATLPLRFTLALAPLDRERAPEAIRHRPPQP